jgi:hypothetical protein
MPTEPTVDRLRALADPFRLTPSSRDPDLHLRIAAAEARGDLKEQVSPSCTIRIEPTCKKHAQASPLSLL